MRLQILQSSAFHQGIFQAHSYQRLKYARPRQDDTIASDLRSMTMHWKASAPKNICTCFSHEYELVDAATTHHLPSCLYTLQDFKEAARLAAEAKAKAAEADSELARAEDLRKQAMGLTSEEAAAALRLDGLESALMSAQRQCALASWRQLKASFCASLTTLQLPCHHLTMLPRRVAF